MSRAAAGARLFLDGEEVISMVKINPPTLPPGKGPRVEPRPAPVTKKPANPNPGHGHTKEK